MGSKFSKAVRRPVADKVTVTPIRQTTPPGTAVPRDSTPAPPAIEMESEARQVMSLPYIMNTSPRVAFSEGSATAPATSQPDTEVNILDVSNMDTTEQAENRAVQERAVGNQEVDTPAQGVLANAMTEELQPPAGQPLSNSDEQTRTEATTENPSEQTMTDVQEPPEVTIQCIVCCEQYPKKDEYKKIIYPCRPCGSAFCGSCIKNMFTGATEKTSKMPPRCCGQLNLHVARPFLTDDEAAAFKTKYEEWSTQNPFYCPVPICSVFIPNRLLPRPTKKVEEKPASADDTEKGKARVDSVVGTPETPLVNCPACEAPLCTQCRQPAHPGAMCSKIEFGQIDEATAELLKGWGYKRCPKCGNGVRRMFGCNHMECLCGAHWCWVCQLPRDECDGGCYEAEDEYDPAFDDQEDVPTEPPAESAGNEEAGAAATAAPQPTQREMNLDAGTRSHWEGSGLHFGDEPSEEIQDRVWECRHTFETAKTQVAESLLQPPTATHMECTRCWNTVYPEMEFPLKAGNRTRMASGYSRRFGRNAHYPGRGRGRGRGRGYAGMPPIPRGFEPPPGFGFLPGFGPPGFAPPPGFGSPPGFAAPVEARRMPPEPFFDMYGNYITEMEVDAQSIRSLDISPQVPRMSDTEFNEQLAVYSTSVPTTGFDKIMMGKKEGDNKGPFSFAYECSYCGVLVCEKCKKDLLDEQEG